MYQRGIFIGLTLLLACARLNAGEASEGDAFSFVIDEPHVRVTIPGLPMLSMNPHPLGDEDPQFRLLGTAKGVSVAAIAPLAEKGITAVECASAIANSILEHRKIGADQVFKGRTSENTFLIIYGLSGQSGGVQLNTHLLSAAGGTHCIEIHISRESTSEADVEPWFNGFGEARIDLLDESARRESVAPDNSLATGTANVPAGV